MVQVKLLQWHVPAQYGMPLEATSVNEGRTFYGFEQYSLRMSNA